MALFGLMLMLDEHSTFLTPKDFLETLKQTSGHYGSIGNRTERRDGAQNP